MNARFRRSLVACSLYACLFSGFAAGQDQAQRTQGDPDSKTLAAPKDTSSTSAAGDSSHGTNDASAATPRPGADSPSEVLNAISSLAQSSIDAANRSAEHTKTVYELALAVVGLFGVALTLIGISNLKSLMATVQKRAADSADKTIRQLQDEITTLTQQARDSAENAKIVVLETGHACRKYNMWEFSNYAGSKRTYLADAIEAIGKARKAAVSLEDKKHEAWTYSFEGLCRKELGEWSTAVDCLEKSIACYERNDPSMDYNMACYCCLSQQDERALKHLRKAFETDDVDTAGSLRRDARRDPDFLRWRQQGLYEDLVGKLEAEPKSAEESSSS